MQHKCEYIWALIGRFLPMFVYLVTTMILARYLDPQDFGMIGVLSVFFMVANTLMDAGLGGSLVKEPNITELDCSTIFIFNIVVSTLLYIVIFLFSNTIEQYFDTDGLSDVVKILCIIFITNSIGLVPRALLTRDLRFQILTYTNIAGVVLAAIVSIIMAIFHFGVYALVAYQIVNSVVGVLLSFKVSRFKINLRFSRKSLFRLMPFGIFTTLATIIDTVYENLITFLFGKYMNMQQAGYVYQAKRLEEVPSQTVAQTISTVSFPVLTQLRFDRKQFSKECANTFKTILLMTLPLLFTMSVFSEIIIILIFGRKWIPAAPYLSLLAMAAVFHIAESLNRSFIKSTTQVAKLVSYTVIKRVIGIAVIFAFLLVDPKEVLVGYVVSTIIGYLLNVHLLSRVSETSIKNQLLLFAQVLLPSVAYYGIMVSVKSIYNSVSVQIMIGCTLLIIYYVGVLRLYNIDFITFFIRFIKKTQKI